MKKFDLLSSIVNGVLSALIGISGAGCLITAFDLSVSGGVLVMACLFWAAATTACFAFKRGWLALPAAAVLWLGYLWNIGIVDELGSMLYSMFFIYNRAYSTGIPTFLLDYFYTDVTNALALIAAVCTVTAGISLRRGRTLGALSAAVLPLVPCFIVTNTVPHAAFLFLTVLCTAIIVLTKRIRQENIHQGSRLAAMVLMPVVLANSLLFYANPRDEYVAPDDNDSIFDAFMDLLEGLIPKDPGKIDIPITLPPIVIDDSIVNLGLVGPKNPITTRVMEVSASYPAGTIYLRGRSYGRYTGTAWTTTEGTENFGVLQDIYLSYAFGMNISIKDLRPKGDTQYYLPYYPANVTVLTDGYLEKPSTDDSYSFTVNSLFPMWKTTWRNSYSIPPSLLQVYAPEVPEIYLELPEQTRADALKILDQNINYHADIITVAEKIGNFVQNSASYSLDTSHMPMEADDFAIWFLTESDTGYCVHFASAAAVLLRAAGIPARYVEGYTVTVEANTPTYVTEDRAHAWVEYYVPMVGWVVLESTPESGWNPPVVDPTEPTQPTEPTRPTEPTQPTNPTTVPTDPFDTTPGTSVPMDTTPGTSVPTDTTPGTTGPIGTGPGTSAGPVTPPDPPDLRWLWTTLTVLCGIAAAVCVIIGQWRLRLGLRRKRLYTGSCNDQALRRWRYTQHLARLRRQRPPEPLKQLAQKARFSQDPLTEEELAPFDGYFDRSIQHLRQRNWLLQLVYRLIFAIY